MSESQTQVSRIVSSHEGSRFAGGSAETGGNATEVTVVIPVLNAQRTLSVTLESLAIRRTKPVEVVVVDGGSTDATSSIAQAWGATFVSGRFKRSSARRKGAELAHGRFLLFLDSDQRVSPGLIEGCLGLCNEQDFDALVIPEEDDCWGFWSKCRLFDRILTSQRGQSLSYPRFISKSWYTKSGGHVTGLEDYMEDRDLFLRLSKSGARVGVAPASVVNSLDRLNPIDLGIKGAKAARDARSYYLRNRGSEETPFSVIAPRFEALIPALSSGAVSLRTALLFPAYAVAVHGPRFVMVVLSWLGTLAFGRNA